MHMHEFAILKQAKEQGIEVSTDADFSKINNDKAIDLLKSSRI